MNFDQNKIKPIYIEEAISANEGKVKKNSIPSSLPNTSLTHSESMETSRTYQQFRETIKGAQTLGRRESKLG